MTWRILWYHTNTTHTLNPKATRHKLLALRKDYPLPAIVEKVPTASKTVQMTGKKRKANDDGHISDKIYTDNLEAHDAEMKKGAEAMVKRARKAGFTESDLSIFWEGQFSDEFWEDSSGTLDSWLGELKSMGDIGLGNIVFKYLCEKERRIITQDNKDNGYIWDEYTKLFKPACSRSIRAYVMHFLTYLFRWSARWLENAVKEDCEKENVAFDAYAWKCNGEMFDAWIDKIKAPSPDAFWQR